MQIPPTPRMNKPSTTIILKIVIFSLWWHAEFFNEKFIMNRYFYADSEYNNVVF